MRPRRSNASPFLEPLESRLLCSASTPTDTLADSQPSAAATASAHPQLPDLLPWANRRRGYVYGWNLDRTEQPGHLLLRLTTAIANIGVGKTVAGGTKTSFCLTDSDQWPTTLPNASADGSYFACDAKMQGISVGWADVYSSTLADQWIDITNVKPGKYWLEVVADPHNRIRESNEKNNTARILVNLRDIKPPHNDTFANRINLSGATVSTSGHNNGATLEAGEADH